MSREILFRGKTKDGRWVYGDLVRRLVETTWQDILGEYQFAIAGTGEREKTVDFKNKRAEVISCTTVDPATVGQFTGLCDKNGVKIFEGDIVDIWSAGQHCHGLVKWGQGSVSFFVEVPCTPHIWHLSGGGKNYDEETCEVIGNIHDTPDLAKEEDKQ